MSLEWSVEEAVSWTGHDLVQTELTRQFNNATVTVASDLLPFGETSYVVTIRNTHGKSQNATVTVNRSTDARPTVTIAGPKSTK